MPGADRAEAGKRRLVLGMAGGLLALDALSKWLVQRTFHPGESVPVVGDLLRLTYVLNPGAAFGLSVGPWSREVFAAVAVVATGVLAVLVRATPGHDRIRLVALSLVLGGAVGNLLDRLRSPGGVVDFLDVGMGVLRWPVFNVADVGVTCGALLLVLLVWREEREEAAVGG